MTYWVYILSNASGMLYTGVTGNIVRRMAEHRSKSRPGFTRRYNITRLVHVEETWNVHAALAREKQIKGWSRAKKLALIDSTNPERLDLAASIFEPPGSKDPSLRSG